MPHNNLNLRNKVEDNELDLSLMELTSVPVKEIASLTNVTSLELSNNCLKMLPPNFPTLTHLTKLDLSRNQITELPINFGKLCNLRHLDLYSNEIERLPTSFGDLKNLRWLDLKDNPLVPAVRSVAGDCLDNQQCKECAINIVKFMKEMGIKIESEKQRVIEEAKHRESRRRIEEDAERRRIAAEQKKQKEKQKAQKKSEYEKKRQLAEEHAPFQLQYKEREVKLNGGTTPKLRPEKRHLKEIKQMKKSTRSSFLGCVKVIISGLLLLMAFVTAMLWYYTGGNLTYDGIHGSIPQIKDDIVLIWSYVLVGFGHLKVWAGYTWVASKDVALKVWEFTQFYGSIAWTNIKEFALNYEEYYKILCDKAPIYWQIFMDYMEILFSYVLSVLSYTWQFIETNGPIILEYLNTYCNMLYTFVQQKIGELRNLTVDTT